MANRSTKFWHIGTSRDIKGASPWPLLIEDKILAYGASGDARQMGGADQLGVPHPGVWCPGRSLSAES